MKALSRTSVVIGVVLCGIGAMSCQGPPLNREVAVISWLHESPVRYDNNPGWLFPEKPIMTLEAWIDNGRHIRDLRTILAKFLRTNDARVDGQYAAYALGYLGAKEHACVLREALDSDDSYVRRAAAWALGRLGDRGAVGRLCDLLLKDRSEIVRAYVALGLELIGDRAAEDSLREALVADQDEFVRRSARHALDRLKRVR